MAVETVDDLCNQIADWIGVYGSCKNESGCEDKNPLCCRQGFMMVLSERMGKAVEVDQALASLYVKENNITLADQKKIDEYKDLIELILSVQNNGDQTADRILQLFKPLIK